MNKTPKTVQVTESEYKALQAIAKAARELVGSIQFFGQPNRLERAMIKALTKLDTQERYPPDRLIQRRAIQP